MSILTQNSTALVTDKNDYQLIYQGPSDDSPETLRKLKGALIADLELSIEEASRILEDPPVCVTSSPDRKAIRTAAALLERAGAEVTIEEPQVGYEDAQDGEDDEFLFEVDLDDDDDPTFQARKKPVKPPRVYDLNELEDSEQSASSPNDEDLEEVSALVNELRSKAMVEKSPSIRLDRIVPATKADSDPSKEGVQAPTPDSREMKSSPLMKTPRFDEEPQEQATPKEGIPPEQIPEEEDAASPTEAAASTQREDAIQDIPPAVPPARAAQKKSKDAVRLLHRRRRLKLVGETIFAVSVSALILAGGIWLMKMQSQASKESPLKKQLNATINEITKNDSASQEEGLVPSMVNSQVLSAVQADREKSIHSEFKIVEGKLVGIQITVTTPPPAELSPEEVINRKEQAPWLEKIVVEKLSITEKEGGSFLAQGSAKAFLEYKKRKYRLLATAVLSGELAPNPPSIAAKLLINHGYSELPLHPGLVFEKLSAKEFRFFLSTKISAQ